MSEKNKLISVILNNYNYAAYLSDAVESVLNQTYKDFELIIVDDGSTDNSCDIISKFAAKDSRIIPITKENGGQASAFNAGFAASRGDIITFLDSDDEYFSDKLQNIAEMHGKGYEYIYTDFQAFDVNGKDCGDTLRRYRCDGYNLFPVYYLSTYPGNITSTLSVSRELAEKIFPVHPESDWRIQADDTIVFQAAMAVRAFFLDKKLTKYRIHGTNGYYGKKQSSDFVYSLLRKRNALKDVMLAKMKCSDTFLRNAYNLIAEFSSHRLLTPELLRIYLRILWYEMDLPLLNKINSSYKIIRLYYKKTGREKL
jgi:glycosyltransferase involved in cell wall biosynthesis